MRLCVLTDQYPPNHRGGAAVIAANLAERYASRGHDVTVVTGVDDEADAGRRRRNGVTVESFVVPTIPPLRAYYSVYHPLAVRKVDQILDRYDFDAVHSHVLNRYLSLHSLKLAKQHSLPVVLTHHDAMSVEYGKLMPNEPPNDGDVDLTAYRVSPWEQLKRKRVSYFPLRNWLNRRYLNAYVNVGVSVSRALHDALSVNGVRSSKVIHNGINPEPYDEADPKTFEEEYDLADSAVILYSGRASYHKGGEHLARAFVRVAESCETDVRLVVTGSRTDFVERMQQLAGRYGDRIVATGWIDEPLLRSAYKAATVVATPSIYLDPFPTVNLEAMAAGTPVVSTCYGGSKELVVDGETGFVVNPRDVPTFAAKLRELVSNPERRRKYGANARRHVESEFSLEEQTDAYLDVIESL